MPLEPYDPSNVIGGQIYRDDNYELWECIGIIDRPAAVLQNIKTGQKITEIIGCMNADRFTQLIEKQPQPQIDP